ncbi:caveolin-3-like [Aethina tumida]|uniref:caveolin-3-like n=1 Tax=Aethina tumida TaxID=116153 RepID=UPI00214784B2|nr:caveolin-3-like [Aethina tumida]
MSKEPSEMVDLEDRDPNTLSQHLQVSWDEVFGEPDTIRSPECAWSVSHQCFRLSRNCCYTCLSVLCAPIAAFLMGITFACISFKHIWCLNPCLRIWKITCASTRNFVAACAQAIVVPCTESFGYFWSQIRVKLQKLPDGNDRKEDVLLI